MLLFNIIPKEKKQVAFPKENSKIEVIKNVIYSLNYSGSLCELDKCSYKH